MFRNWKFGIGICLGFSILILGFTSLGCGGSTTAATTTTTASSATTTTSTSGATTTTSTTTTTTSTTTLQETDACTELGCPAGTEFVGSINSDRYHYCWCRSAKRINPENLVCFSNKEEAQAEGYVPCGVCKPPS